MAGISRLAAFSALALGVGLALSASTVPQPPPGEENSPSDQDSKVAFRHEPNVLHIDIGGRPFADYVYSHKVITRPFFAHVKSPAGIQVTRNHPPDPDKDLTDHDTMHPGLWMSFGDISGNDYWRLKAKVEHEMFVESPEGGPGQGTFTVRNYYRNREGSDRIAAEVASYTISVEPDGYLLLWESTFTPHGETQQIVFGDQEEMGLGIRVQTRLAEQFGGEITDSAGRKGAKQIWSKQADWIDYSGTLEGKWIGMTIMPDPANFRPSWYHARDYGFIAANVFGQEAMKAGPRSAVAVKKGDALRLRYGVLIHSSDSRTGVDLKQAYRRFLARVGSKSSARTREAAAAEPPAVTRPGPLKHVTVFKEKGRFGGWPANQGIWSWGNEILVGFEAGHLEPKEVGHAIDYARPAVHSLARSLDGGETWTIETPPGLRPPPGQQVARVPTGTDGKPTVPFVGTMDFANPDFALTARMLDIHVGPSRFYYTQDRGHTWQGPFEIPDFGQKGIAARTDYLVEGPHELTMFLTAAKESDRQQGRVICVRTKDGGRTWTLVSLVEPEPPAGQKAIMPSSVRMDGRTILTAVRCKGSIDLYRSEDNGGTWSFVGTLVPDTGANNGNPPCLTRLKDGRLALTYGYRSAPYGVRARLSTDAGRSWGHEITLRQDGGAWDLGYARTVQRPDGMLVTVYYFNDGPEQERYIAATIWDPGATSVASGAAAPPSAPGTTTTREPETAQANRRFEAPEARQAVAVSERHFYVFWPISSHSP